VMFLAVAVFSSDVNPFAVKYLWYTVAFCWTSNFRG
jgi:hypothetical protein